MEREKIFSYLEYKALQLKHYFEGESMPDDEFESLINYDFDQIRQNIPPFEEEGEFDASAEIQRLRDLPKEQRREALEKIKEKIRIQTEAWAQCKLMMEKCVSFKDDFTKEELLDKIVVNFGTLYGFTQDQLAKAEALIDLYISDREKIKEARKIAKDDVEFANLVLGDVIVSEGDDFEITHGPVSVEIMVSNKLAEKLSPYEFANKRSDLSKEEKADANGWDGYANNGSDKNLGIPYIAIKKESGLPLLTGPKHILSHERRHIINNLFARTVMTYRSAEVETSESERDFEELKSFLETEQDADARRVQVQRFLEKYQKIGLAFVRDEILAIKDEGWLMRDQKDEGKLADLFIPGAGYDFLDDVREFDFLKNNSEYQEMMTKTLVKEYDRIIFEALHAFTRLQQSDFGYKQAIAILIDRPLQSWPKETKRLIG